MLVRNFPEVLGIPVILSTSPLSECLSEGHTFFFNLGFYHYPSLPSLPPLTMGALFLLLGRFSTVTLVVPLSAISATWGKLPIATRVN